MVWRPGPSAESRRLYTAEHLALLPDDGHRHQLVEGELVREPPPGFDHGSVVARIARALLVHVERTGTGFVVAGDSGFILHRGPDTVLAPDVAFIARERMPRRVREQRPWPEVAPDLVVEVKSPSDSRRGLVAKAQRWLKSGTRMVWIVDPAAREVIVVRPDHELEPRRDGDVLSGDPILPGLMIPVEQLWPD